MFVYLFISFLLLTKPACTAIRLPMTQTDRTAIFHYGLVLIFFKISGNYSYFVNLKSEARETIRKMVDIVMMSLIT